MSLYQIYKENEFGGEPKYIHLSKSIKRSIEKGILKKSDRLPSITELQRNLNLGKDTILKAIDLLKSEGIITAVHGKGFFVSKTQIVGEYRLFVLFDEFTAYKKSLYYAMLESLKGKGEIELFFHHCNLDIFNKLLSGHKGEYTHYIIMPVPDKQIVKSLDVLPQDKLYLLDRDEFISENIPAVFQDYEKDVYDGFLSIQKQLKRYEKIYLVFPPNLNLPLSVVRGFERACIGIGIDSEVIGKVRSEDIKKGQAWFVIEDDDLVDIVELVQKRKWVIGKDLGLISYNETPMKRIAAGGITTLSTDFSVMGKMIMKMIFSGKDNQLRCVGKITDRGSL